VAGVGLPGKRPRCKGDTTTADTTQEPDLECNESVEETTVTDTPFQRTKGCAGYLGHLFAELDVLCFIERAFLSKHTMGTYNHYGLESLAVLSFCLR
jgi:hypothetical protein